jgi:hypothetical protein
LLSALIRKNTVVGGGFEVPEGPDAIVFFLALEEESDSRWRTVEVDRDLNQLGFAIMLWIQDLH